MPRTNNLLHSDDSLHDAQNLGNPRLADARLLDILDADPRPQQLSKGI